MFLKIVEKNKKTMGDVVQKKAPLISNATQNGMRDAFDEPKR